jgi:RimJ/RimL family protein N-acetyltransferase
MLSGHGTNMGLSTEQIFSTQRCLLRCPRPSDAAAILEAVTHPDFPKEVPFGQLVSLEAIDGAIRRRLERWRAGTAYEWCADECSSGQLVAMVGVRRDERTEMWALGFWVTPTRWRQGFATELGRRVLDIAFDHLSLDSMAASAAIWNVASQRVLKNLGFSFRREIPDGYRIQGKPIKTAEFDISVQQWKHGALGC